MRISEYQPSPALAPFVEKLSIVESDEEVTRALVPELGLIVGVRFRGAAYLADARLPDAAITGMQRRARQMRTAARSGIVLAHFRPGGASVCFPWSLHDLLGATEPLDAVLGRAQVATLLDRVGSATANAERVAILDATLVERVRTATAAALDPVAVVAARSIAAAGGQVRIAELAAQLGVSQDPLEKRFRRAIGASPKQLAKLARLRRAIALATLSRTHGNLSRVAIDAGYFDQSHFNRDFRAVTGTSPSEFFRKPTHC